MQHPLIDSQGVVKKPEALSSKTRRDMIEAGGRLFQILGLPRSTGQIYGLLYLSLRPLSLDDVVDMLGISKASASMGMRHLSSWGAIRQVWVPGERRDYYEAIGDLGTLISGTYREFIKPRLKSSQTRLSRMLQDLEEETKGGNISKEEYKFCSERLQNLSKLQKKFQSLAPLAEKFL